MGFRPFLIGIYDLWNFLNEKVHFFKNLFAHKTFNGAKGADGREVGRKEWRNMKQQLEICKYGEKPGLEFYTNLISKTFN